MRSGSNEYDAIVVGGGPAGAGTASWLARSGFHVALLDRARFPRDKACGEFLTPEACRLLNDLGAWESLLDAGARLVNATVLVAPDGSQTRHTPPNGKPTGYAVRRTVLDSLLLENARRSGVDVWEGAAVRELLQDSSGQVCGVNVRNAEGSEIAPWRARLVIGADGSHSLVARQLGLVKALPRLQRVAVVSHWHNVAGHCDTIEMRASGERVCGLGFPGSEVADVSPPPLSSGSPAANLTLVVPTRDAARIAGRPGDFVEETIATLFPDLAQRLSGATRETAVRTVGCFGHRSRPSVADGALLVGDAATFIDPFTGEGVYFALRGAQLAAEIAAQALRAGDVSRRQLMPYHKARQELSRRYLLCDIVQTIVRRPALLTQVVQRLDRFPKLADRLLGVLSDTRPPTDALHPGFLWRLLAPEL